MENPKHKTTGDGRPRKGRSCGACTECCIRLEIESKPGFSTRLDTGEDIAKPAGVPCVYLGDAGCSIYAVRPAVCRQFACDWVLGEKNFAASDSPLETGILGVRGVTLHFALPTSQRRA